MSAVTLRLYLDVSLNLIFCLIYPTSTLLQEAGRWLPSEVARWDADMKKDR